MEKYGNIQQKSGVANFSQAPAPASHFDPDLKRLMAVPLSRDEALFGSSFPYHLAQLDLP